MSGRWQIIAGRAVYLTDDGDGVELDEVYTVQVRCEPEEVPATPEPSVDLGSFVADLADGPLPEGPWVIVCGPAGHPAPRKIILTALNLNPEDFAFDVTVTDPEYEPLSHDYLGVNPLTRLLQMTVALRARSISRDGFHGHIQTIPQPQVEVEGSSPQET